MNILKICMLVILQMLYNFGDSRPIPLPAQIAKRNSINNVQIEKRNSTNNVQIEKRNFTNIVQMERVNTTKNDSGDALEQNTLLNKLPTLILSNGINYTLRHIPRSKRQTPVVPTEFHLVHTPCELDISNTHKEEMTVNCRHVWSNRFVSADFYKLCRIYQLEGFTFGQYYERLRRYETEHHTFNYQFHYTDY